MNNILKLAVAAVAVTALVGAPSASAGSAHLLGSYKVEKHLDVQGEDGDYTISCPNNDIAIDGMWRVDNVDQDNDYVYDPAPTSPANPALDVLNSLEPVAAYPDSASVSKWIFKFIAMSGGNVQGKLSLFCLPKRPTTYQGHSVDWLPGARQTSAPQFIAAPTGGATYSKLIYNSTDCAPGEIAIQPGFEWVPTVAPAIPQAWGKPFMRYPTSTSAWRNYKWGFFTPSGGTVKLYWRCLPLLSDWSNKPSSATGHRHKLVRTPKVVTSPQSQTIKKKGATEVQVICGEHYKAAIGAWDFGYSSYTWLAADHHKKLWYLGMDPRPKSRAFKILNTDPTVDQLSGPALPVGTPGLFASLCFKTKTT